MWLSSYASKQTNRQTNKQTNRHTRHSTLQTLGRSKNVAKTSKSSRSLQKLCQAYKKLAAPPQNLQQWVRHYVNYFHFCVRDVMRDVTRRPLHGTRPDWLTGA